MQYVKHAVDFSANMQSDIFSLYIWNLYTVLCLSHAYTAVTFSSAQLCVLVSLYFVQLHADCSMASTYKLFQSGSQEQKFLQCYYVIKEKGKKIQFWISCVVV